MAELLFFAYINPKINKMFKRYQKLVVKMPIYGNGALSTVYYFADYLGFERDSNLIAVPQTKLIVQDIATKKIYHISPTDIIDFVDGID